jgi:Phosphotransferase enzyme family
MSDTTDMIARRYEAERANPHLALTALDIPGSYDAFTTDWLTAVLCRNANGARVTSFDFGDRDDGTTNRRRIYLRYNRQGDEQGLPASVFCKATIDLSNRITLGACGSAHAEATFYEKVRPRLTLEAPQVYHARFDPRSFAYIILMRDIGHEVEFCTEHTPMDRGRAESQVRLLADLHGRFYESPELGTPTLPLVRWTDWWANLMTMDYGIYCRKGQEAAEQVIPHRLFARRDQIWGATIASVEAHRRLPQMVLHADVHLKNWYITANGAMGLSDWQNCCIGHWGRDLAYAITTALAPDDRRAWERDLIALYLDQLASHGIPKIPFEDAFTLYRQQIFGALAYWTSTLCPPDDWADMQPSDTSIAFIHRMATAIDDLDALNSFAV